MPNLGALADTSMTSINRAFRSLEPLKLGDIIPNFDCQSTIGDLQVHEYLGDR